MRRAFQFHLRQRAKFAGHAEMREQVRTVRSDLHLEHGVCFHDLVERSSYRRVGAEDHEPLVIISEAEFLAAAHHALAEHAAQFALLDFEIAGHHCPRKRQRHLISRREVLCTAHDLPRGARSVVHLAEAEFVGVRMLLERFHLRDDDLLAPKAALLNALHLHPGEGQQISQFRYGTCGEVEVVGEP